MSFWSSVGAWFKRVIVPVFRASVQSLIDKLLPAALDVVIRIAADPSLVSNDQKRAAFGREIVVRARAAGIALASEAVINLLRELAVETARATGRIAP